MNSRSAMGRVAALRWPDRERPQSAYRRPSLQSVVVCLSPSWRDVPDGFGQLGRVESVRPLQGGQFPGIVKIQNPTGRHGRLYR